MGRVHRAVAAGAAAGLAAVTLGFVGLTLLLPLAGPVPQGVPPGPEASPSIAALTDDPTPPPAPLADAWVELFAQGGLARSDAGGNAAGPPPPARPAPQPDPGPALLGPPGVGNRAPARAVQVPVAANVAAAPEAAAMPEGPVPAAPVPAGLPQVAAPAPVGVGATVPAPDTPRGEPAAPAASADPPPASATTPDPAAPAQGVVVGRLPQVVAERASPPDPAQIDPPEPVVLLEVADAPPSAPTDPSDATAPDTAPGVVVGRLPQVVADEGASPPDPAPLDPPEPVVPLEVADAPPSAPTDPSDATAPDAAPGVVVGRLPQVAAPAAEATATLPALRLPGRNRLPQVGDATPAASASPDSAPPAWVRFRAAPPGALPPLGLVLLDTGADPQTEAALVGFPVSLTLALDPFDPDAPRRAAVYRAAGHEVALALGGIAPGATATDLEVILESWSRDFPQALALAELPPLGGREARALAPVLVPALQARGLALIAPDRGLSPLLAAARAQGVPAVGLYRALDAGDEDGPVLRRLLDRAAFEAERGGGAVVWGQAGRPDTRAALLGWVGTGRAARVAAGAAGALLPAP